jgi:flagellar assembly protein FliH
MSSFDPLPQGVPPAGGEFAPLVAPLEEAGAAPASVFPDFNRREPAAPPGEPPPPEPAGKSALELEHEAGYAAGFAAGRASMEQELATNGAAFAAAMEEVVRFRAGLLERYHRELLDLALEVARKVVERELDEHPEHWLQMIRDGVARSVEHEVIRIRVGSILHRYLVNNLAELRAKLDDVKELDLVEDTSLPATGCVITTSSCDLDLGIDSQMSAIRVALTTAD